MKVLVDISEDVLARMKLVSKVSSVDGVCQAVLDGTVLDNLTNGEVIKAVFPKDYIHIYDRSVSSWWNAPYKVDNKPKRGLNYADQDTLMSAT